VPGWVFCSREGTPLNGDNVSRVWQRVRRRAQTQGVRPLALHAARHGWATEALRAGKSIRWVADQLGHADPSLTLRVYAHALRE
jgi:integrase